MSYWTVKANWRPYQLYEAMFEAGEYPERCEVFQVPSGRRTLSQTLVLFQLQCERQSLGVPRLVRGEGNGKQEVEKSSQQYDSSTTKSIVEGGMLSISGANVNKRSTELGKLNEEPSPH